MGLRVSTGTIKFFNTTKAFGFITPDSGPPDVFVHVSGLADGVKSLDAGTRVSFETEPNERGPKAVRVRRIA